MKTHPTYDESGNHIAGINCNVYLCKQDIHDLGRVLACLEAIHEIWLHVLRLAC